MRVIYRWPHRVLCSYCHSSNHGARLQQYALLNNNTHVLVNEKLNDGITAILRFLLDTSFCRERRYLYNSQDKLKKLKLVLHFSDFS